MKDEKKMNIAQPRNIEKITRKIPQKRVRFSLLSVKNNKPMKHRY